MPWSSLRRWLRALTSKKNKRTIRPKISVRHGFDVLEDRTTPAQFTWNAVGGGGDLMDPTKWQGGVAPNGVDADLVFPEATVSQVIAITNNTVPPIAFKSLTFSGGGYTLSGPNPIKLGFGSTASSIAVSNSTLSATNTLAVGIILQGPSSNISITSSGLSLNISGAINDTVSTAAGAPSLTKTGNGTLNLSGNNIGFDGTITATSGGGIINVSSANALGSLLGETTIQAGAQLRIANTGTINENLIVSGSLGNLGVVLNASGNNTLNGSIRMDSSSTFGANQNTTLTITGVVSDFNGAQQFTKEGTGTIALAAANTYRGQTNINHGTVAISNARALGATTAGTLVNTDNNGDGTLRIDGGATGLTIVDEVLSLNGFGAQFGSIYNNTGNNVWTGNVNMGGNGDQIGVGNLAFGTNVWVNPSTTLTILGVVQDPDATATELRKFGTGTLELYRANTYTGYTTIYEGMVRIRDSMGMGTADSPGFDDTYIVDGATLEMVIKGATDVVTGAAPVDSVSGQPDMIQTPENIIAVGLGVTVGGVQVGAIHSVSGRNTMTGAIRLGDMEIFQGMFQDSFDGGIGVEPPLVETADDTYFTADWSLTIPGTEYGDNLVKLGNGHLILPEFGDYDGTTDIQAGWITIRNADALGDYNLLLNDTQQAEVTVRAGAALHLLPMDDGSPMQLFKNITISGDGIAHANPKLNRAGALVNLGGDNLVGMRIDPNTGALVDTLGGIITLNGAASIGVSDPVAPTSFSQLLIKSSITQPVAPATPAVGILTKLGPQRLILQDASYFTGDFNIKEGVVRIQHDNGMGANAGNTIVSAGAALEIMSGVTTENGGIAAGIQFGAGEHLVLNGAGNTTFGLLPLTVYDGDNLFRGQVTLNTNITLDVRAGSRFMIAGKIDDATTTEPSLRSNLTLIGGGTLDLGGNSTYRGATYISADSVLAIRHSGALGFADGTPNTGTFIADGASLQLIGNMTVSGEYLEIQGSGATGATTTPRWFSQGPATISNGDTLGANANVVAGSVINVQSDPMNGNSLFVSTSGGGAFRSVDGGLHWSPIFDNAFDGTSNFAVDSQTLFGGFITVSPYDPNKIYFATGDGAEDRNAYYGRGVYKSLDGGATWTLLTTPLTVVNPSFENPLDRRGVTKLVVDPADDNDIFVSVTDNTVDGLANQAGIWRYTPAQGWYNMTGTTPGTILPNNPVTPTRTTAGATDVGPEEDPTMNFGDSADFSDLYISDVYLRPSVSPGATGKQAQGQIQGVTLTAVDGGLGGNFISIRFLAGGRMGREEVRDFSGFIEVYIEVGKTTVAMVRNAINNDPVASLDVIATSSSSGSTLVQPSGSVFLSGGDSINNGTLFVPDQILMFAKSGSAVFRTNTMNSDQPVWKIADGRTIAPGTGGGAAAFPNPRSVANPTVGYRNGLIKFSTSFGNLGGANYLGTSYAIVSDGDNNMRNSNYGTNYVAYKSVGAHTISNPGAVTDYKEVGQVWTVMNVPNFLEHDFATYSSIIASPLDARVVYIAGYRQIYRSGDGGATWININVDQAGFGVSPGINSLSFDANDRLLVATEEGVWRFEYTSDTNFSWATGYSGKFRVGNLNGEGLNIANINYISANPADATKIIAGADAVGTIITANGSAWTRVNDPVGTPAGVLGGKVYYDPSDPNIIYRVFTDYGGNRVQLQRSINGGVSFSNIGFSGSVWPKPTSFSGSYEILGGPLVVDPVNSDRVLFGDLFDVHESLNSGSTFRFLGNGVFGVTTWVSPASYQGAYVREAASSPFFAIDDRGSDSYDPDTIWAVSDYDTVLLTKDYGTNWDDRTPGALPMNAIIHSVTVDPRNRDTAYIVVEGYGTAGKLYVTTDAGVLWTDITNNLDDSSVHSFAIDPRTGDLYVGNETGIFRLQSGSMTWVRFGEGLPQVSVRDIRIDTTLNTITIGTFGRGVYTLWLSDVLTTQASLLAVSGNPSWGGTINIKGDTTIGAQGTQSVPDDSLNASLSIVGVIDDSTGAFNLTKVGQGDVVLGGSNTYDGNTFVAEGVVIVRNQNALGSNVGVTYVAENTALELQSSITSGETLYLKGKGFDVNGQFGGALRNTSGNNVFNGQIFLQNEDPTPPPTPPTIIHQYDFNGNFNDSVGSLPIVPVGGTLGTGPGFGTFNFSANPFPTGQGLRLPNAFVNPGDYSIEMRFQFDDNFSWGKVIDFKNLAFDAGVYTYYDSIGTYPNGGPYISGPYNTFQINTYYTLLITREAATKLFVLYLDSGAGFVEQARYIDLGDDAIFDGTNNNAYFFLEDTVGSLDAKGGIVDYIRIYDKPLTVASVPQSTVTGVVIGVDSNSSLTITGTIADDPTNSTAPNLSKDLTGTLILTNANTFDGTVNVFQGELQIQHNQALGTTAAGTIVYQGAQLSLSSGALPGFTVAAEPLSLSGAGKFDGILDEGALYNVSGNNTWTGAVILDSVPPPAAPPVTEYVGIGVKNATDTLLITGNITQAGTGTSYGLRKLGAGTVVLTGNNTYTDTTYVEAGWLNVRSDTALGTANVGTVVFNGASLQLQGDVTIVDEQLNLQGSGPTTRGALESVSGDNVWDGLVMLDNSTLVYVDAGRLTIKNTTGPFAIVNNTLPTTTSRDLTKSGVGELDLMSPNVTFGGHLWVDDGVVVVGVSTALGSSAGAADGTSVMAGATLRVLGSTATINENLALNGNGETGTLGALEVQFSAADTLSWTGPITLETSSTISVTGAGTLRVPSKISNGVAGASNLTKQGNGALLFTGATANTYTGQTFVNDGTLLLDKAPGVAALVGNLTVGDGLLGPSTAIVRDLQSQEIPDTITVSVLSDGLLDINGVNETIGTLQITNGNVRTGDAGALTVNALTMTGGTITLGTVAGNLNLVLGGNVAATSSAAPQVATITGAGSVNLGSVPRTFTVAQSGFATPDMIIASPIVGSGTAEVVKMGNGVLALQGPSALNGRARGGVLEVNGSLGTAILQGGTLGGVGTVGGGVTVAAASFGVIAPGPTNGTKIGTLNVGPTVLAPASAYNIDIASVAAHDLLNVTGSINLNGANLTGTFDTSLPLDVQIPIVQATSVTGQFAQGTGMITGGMKFDIFYTPTTVFIARTRFISTLATTTSGTPTVYGQPITVTVTATPEPGATAVENDSPIDITIVGPAPSGATLTFTVWLFGNTASFTLPQSAQTLPHVIPALPILDVGSFQINAHMNQTATFKAADAPVITQQVNKADVQFAFTPTVGSPVFGQNFTINANVSAAAPGSTTPTGNVTFVLDGGAPTAPVSLAAGLASFPVSGLGAGAHTLVINYVGDAHFNAKNNSSAPYSFTIGKATTAVSLTPAPTSTTFGGSVTFTANVTAVAPGAGTPTGTVSFYDTFGGPRVLRATQTLTGGQATFTTSALLAGNHSIDVVYNGDSNFLGLGAPPPGGTPINPVAFVVAKQAVSQTFVALPTSTTFGQSITFTTTVVASSSAPLAPTGAVVFRVDGLVVAGGPYTLNASGQASFIINSLTPGPHTITATYAGDANFLDTSATPATITQSVAKGPTSMALTSTVTPSSAYGQSVIFRATVTPTGTPPTLPTGTVTFTIDGVAQAPVAVNPATGLATFTVANLAPLASPGHTVLATYNGDTNYNSGSNATTNQIVTKATTTINITSSRSSAPFPNYGQPITITATVVPQFAGSLLPSSDVVFSYVVFGVTQTLTRTLNASGVASITVTDMTGPTTDITVTYAGDANYLAATPTTFTQIVNGADSATVLASSGSPVVYGNDNITATVSSAVPGGPTPTGTVTFTLNRASGGNVTFPNVPLNASGVATMPHGPVGAYSTIVATYNPIAGNNYNASSNSLSNQTITAASTALALTASPVPGKFGGTASFQAVVTSSTTPAQVTGQVTFTIDGAPQTPIAVNASGIATFASSALTTGTHVISASFADGNGNFQPSSSPSPINYVIQNGDTVTSLPASSQSFEFLPVSITATVTPTAPSAGFPDGQVRFVVDGGTPVLVTLVSGQATYTASGLAVGSHSVVADYLGSTGKYNPSSAIINHQVLPSNTATALTSSNGGSAAYSTPTTITASVTHVGPGATPTGSVNFSVDGGAAVNVPLNGSGVATLALSQTLSAGAAHTITATYAPNDVQFTPSIRTLSQTFTKANTGTALTASPSVVLGSPQPVTLTATVAIAPAFAGAFVPQGTVTFHRIVNGVPLSLGSAAVDASGVATLVTGALPVGTAIFDAVFAPSDPVNFNGNTVTITGTVATTTTIQTSAASAVYGQPIISARVTPSSAGFVPTGSVVFTVKAGAITVANLSAVLDATGVATLNAAPLGTGAYTVTGTFVPAATEAVFLASTSAPLAQTITRANSSMVLTSSSPPGAVFGEAVNFTATVTAQSPSLGRPTGTVVFMVNGQPRTVNLVAAGTGASVATLTLSGLPVGANSITATYNQTSNFTASSKSLVQQITALNTAVALASTANPAFFTQNVVFVATVGALGSAAIPTGTVTFYIDGVPQQTIPLNSAGQAAFGQTFSTAGNRNILAVFNGTSSFNASTSANLVQSVNGNPIVITVPASFRSGDTFPVTVKLLSAGTNAVDTSYFGPVTLALNTAPVGGSFSSLAGNAVAGVITFNVNLAKAGTYTFKVSAAGLPFIASSPVIITARTLNIVASTFVPASGATNFSLTATDATGATASNFTGPITVGVVSAPAGGTITGNTTGSFSGGVGSVNGLKFTANGKYVLRFFSGNLFVDILVDTTGRVTGA